MGERKGQNKYYPPDFDPKKHRSLDAYHGTHALRERARKLSQGILIIRFEMPYNIWCDGCKNHIGMGVRYNAEKSKVGMYYSTPIYKFRMKCHLCDNHFEIKTDPANHDYVIISGARRKEQRWDPKENEQIVPEDKNDQKKLATDAMYKMEHGVSDQSRSQSAKPRVSQITSINQRMRDDYDLNSLVRSQFRERKKIQKAQEREDDELLSKYSLDVNLVAEEEEDKKLAALVHYQSVVSYDERQKMKREEISKRPMFSVSPSEISKRPVFSVSPSGMSQESSGGSSSLISEQKNRFARSTLASAMSKSKHDPFFSNNVAGLKPSEGQYGIVRTNKTKSAQSGSQTNTCDPDSQSAEVDGDSESGFRLDNILRDTEASSSVINPDQSMASEEHGAKFVMAGSLVAMYSGSSEDSD